VKRLVVALVVMAVVQPAHADDDDPADQKMRFVERGDVLTVSSSALTKLFDTKTYKALENGVASTVVIRIYIYPQGGSDAIAGTIMERRVAYEPWDEIYNLSFNDGIRIEKFKEKRKADALKRITAIDDLPVARLASLPYDQIFLLAMQVELNPVSQETLAEVKRWLSQGTGGGLDRGGAFFGSFVSVFVNPKIPKADRVLRIRSQPFFRPRP
jgi:hypothetical protein